jgi:hypothetical protein
MRLAPQGLRGLRRGVLPYRVKQLGRGGFCRDSGGIGAILGKASRSAVDGGYYGAFVLDPDGDYIEACVRGPAAR